MNNTLRLLSDIAWKKQLEKDRQEPEWRQLNERQEQMLTAFQQKHWGNRELIDQVDQMLDDVYTLGEFHGEYQFLLGLQMGLELRPNSKSIFFHKFYDFINITSGDKFTG